MLKNLKKKNSYAASFGFKEVPKSLKDIYKDRLMNFNNISVRESSGVNIVDKLTGKKAIKSIDPTLLLEKEEWEKLAMKPRAEKYVLLYEVNKASKENYQLAKKIAKEKGLKIIAITQKFYSLDDIRAHQTGPRGLLGYIEHADYVLTDSFHGTVFSIIFEKQFIFCKNSNPDTNIRMLELLSMTNLSNRQSKENYDKTIDWSDVRKNLKQARIESTSYINSIIEEISNV